MIDEEKLQELVNTLEGVLGELKDQLKGKGKGKKAAAKPKAEKKPRTPSAYQLFIGPKMKEIKKNNPTMTQKEVMKMAAEAWKTQPKK